MQDRIICLEQTGKFQIGTARHFAWLKGLVKWLVILNLVDGVLTILWIQRGLATEANVFLHDLAHGEVLWFMLAKLALVSLGVILLWRCRCHRLAVVAIFVAFLAYYLVLLHHLSFFGLLASGVMAP